MANLNTTSPATLFLRDLERNVFKIIKIRERQTKHSGETPKNIISYKPQTIGGEKMSEVAKLTEAVTHADTFKKLAIAGFSTVTGLTLSKLLGNFVASKIPNKLPIVSNRTLSGVAVTAVLYYASRKINQPLLKDITFYGAAGSAIFTVGSLIGDIAGKYLPASAQSVIGIVTGASPVRVEATETIGE